MTGSTQIDKIMKLLLDVAREEKTNEGEFQTLLLSEPHGQSPWHSAETGRKQGTRKRIERRKKGG
jgi:rubrerythrin